jgi:hypothetical protein
MMTAPIDPLQAVIDAAELVPPPLSRSGEELAAEPVRLRTDIIGLLGIGQATNGENVQAYGIGEPLCMYVDSLRRQRVLRPEQHSRIAIGSLFIGHEKSLAQLWPKPNPSAGFDDRRAAEELIADLGRVGGYWPKKHEQITAEADNHGYLLIEATRFARETMRRFGDPYLTLCRLRSWATGSLALSETDITIIVNRLCARLLRRRRGNIRG